MMMKSSEKKDKEDEEGEEHIRSEEGNSVFISPCCNFLGFVVKVFVKCLGHDQDDYSPVPTQTTDQPPSKDPSADQTQTKTTEEDNITDIELARSPPSRREGFTRGGGGQNN
ncbi:uncharacterized protein LOC133828927 [Humulus lupulus]|uniref:uncharacterized protein LOC133828927 n=1 Tax=Humulus lupulus TaxID=3486 RepID=UPI002B41163C|nr:uncharacterized protein LOC133828927 [Humulus lupulus]